MAEIFGITTKDGFAIDKLIDNRSVLFDGLQRAANMRWSAS